MAAGVGVGGLRLKNYKKDNETKTNFEENMTGQRPLLIRKKKWAKYFFRKKVEGDDRF